VIRRLVLAPVTLLVTLAIGLAACGAQAPARPEISDPKEILAETLVSLKDVKSIEFTTAFGGTLNMAELGGNLDLSTTSMSGAFDIAGKKFKLSLDAPSIMGTKVEALGLDGFSYVKVSGLLAGLMGGTADKWMKSAISDSAADVVDDPVEFQKQIDEFKVALDKLPTAPTLGAQEKCGDTDCYHVTLVASSDDLDAASGAAMADGDFTLDLFSRKNDLRPARLVMAITSADFGTISVTFNLTYDVSVSVQAPPADQVVEQ
jgi:hypothetical protein